MSNLKETNNSVSEDHGLLALTDNDLKIYSVGVSTGTIAEIRMAAINPKRQIIATTVDEIGKSDAEQYIEQKGFGDQIKLKLEDVSSLLPYTDHYFDFIYARLILHYLSKQKLKSTLVQLKRILKANGKLYIVVRSTKCPDANHSEATYDSKTGLTTYPNPVIKVNQNLPTLQRFFHTEKSISKYIKEAGFDIAYVKSYEEHLYANFMRSVIAPHTDHVIELLAISPSK